MCIRDRKELREVFDNEKIIKGKIIRRIKGGMVVDLNGVQAFLPGSQIDVRPVKDFDQFLDKEIDLRVVKFNEFRKNVVVSHKAIIEESLKSNGPWLCGKDLTIADIRLFPTLIRWESVYEPLFKCSKKPIQSFPNIIKWRKTIFNLYNIKKHVMQLLGEKIILELYFH